MRDNEQSTARLALGIIIGFGLFLSYLMVVV